MNFNGTDIPVIDTDTHLTERPDLWSARLPSRWVDEGPRVVEVGDGSGRQRWRIGDTWLMAPGIFSYAGWKDFAPSYPVRWDEIDPACYDAHERAAWMDRYQIDVQVLYPNVLAFEGHAVMKMPAELQILCVQAYNDYVAEFAETVPGQRFVPIAMLPFWDIDASIAEMERASALGHKGVLWAAQMEKHGLPGFTDGYWDGFYAAAQRLEMSINFHIGVGETQDELESVRRKIAAANAPGGGEFDIESDTKRTSLHFMSNAQTIAEIVTSGICDRFPALNFVSVESGFGYVPYLMEALDWQWRGVNGPKLRPAKLLPSEYFARQVYATFWFEQKTLPLLSIFPDNVMFETDFPHKTSLTPGRGSASPDPDLIVRQNVEAIGDDIMRKVLHSNAARVYHLV